MKIFLISFVIFCLFLAAMAVGVIFGRRCLRGSCGGLGSCEACASDGTESAELQPAERHGTNPQVSPLSAERN